MRTCRTSMHLHTFMMYLYLILDGLEKLYI